MNILTLIFISSSTQFNLPPQLLESLCYVESKHDVNAVHHDDGNSDSLGACQLKLSSAQQMGFKGNAEKLMVPEINIYYAAKFLSYQLKRYKGSIPRAVTAYNKGSSNSHGYSSYYLKVRKVWKQHESSYITQAAY